MFLESQASQLVIAKDTHFEIVNNVNPFRFKDCYGFVKSQVLNSVNVAVVSIVWSIVEVMSLFRVTLHEAYTSERYHHEVNLYNI